MAVYTAALRRPGRNILLVAFIAGWLCAAVAGPAEAHTTGPQLISSIQGTTPPSPGVSIKILSTGSAPYVTVGVDGHTFQVFGLQGEPFIRVAPDGVSLNRKSPSLYLTKDPTKKPLLLPDTVDPVPDWNHVADASTYSYYETRAEWPHTGQPQEARALGKPVIVYRFSIPASYDGTAVQIVGQVTWIPAPLNLEIPLLFVPLLVVGMLWIEPKAKPHLRAIGRWVGVVVVAAAALDAVRMLLAARAGGAGAAPLALLPGLAVVVGVAAPRLARGNRGAFLAAFALGVYLLVFGVLRVSVPTSSLSLGTWLRRAELVLGLAVTVGAGLLLFLSSPTRVTKRARVPRPLPR